jgi:hypothetical protein
VQRLVLERHRRQVLARGLHRLLDRDRHFTRLAVSEADFAAAIADDGQRGEAELAAALDDFRHAIHCDELFDVLVLRSVLFDSGHGLKLQTVGTRRVG